VYLRECVLQENAQNTNEMMEKKKKENENIIAYVKEWCESIEAQGCIESIQNHDERNLSLNL